MQLKRTRRPSQLRKCGERRRITATGPPQLGCVVSRLRAYSGGDIRPASFTANCAPKCWTQQWPSLLRRSRLRVGVSLLLELRMGLRLDRLIQSAKTDSTITNSEIDQMISEAMLSGGVSAREKKALTKVLAQHSSIFEAAAKAKLEAFLQGGLPPPAPPSPVGPVTLSGVTASRLTAYFTELEWYTRELKHAKLVPDAEIERIRNELGSKLSDARVAKWLNAELTAYRNDSPGPIRWQFVLAALKAIDPSEAARLTGNAEDLHTAALALRNAISTDPVTGETRVPSVLMKLYSTYCAPASPGVNLNSEGWPDSRLRYTRTRVEARNGVPTLLVINEDRPEPNGWNLALVNGKVLVQREGPGAVAPVPLEALTIETLAELNEYVGYVGIASEIHEHLTTAHYAAMQKRGVDEAATAKALASMLRSAIDTARPPKVVATALDSGLHSAQALRWELSKAKEDDRFSLLEVMRMVGAASETPGKAALEEAVRSLPSLSEMDTHRMEGALLLGSAVPWLALGIADSRVASAFPVTAPRIPAEGTPLGLSEIRATLDQGGLNHIRPEVLMFALHQRDVAFANNKVLDKFSEGKLPVKWGYRSSWVQTKGRHSIDGDRNTVATETMQRREIDYSYPLGDTNLALARLGRDQLEASTAGALLGDLPGLKQRQTVPQIITGTVPSAPLEVWATALNPMTYHGRRIAQLSELLDRVEKSGPIDTPAGRVTRESVLASIPDVMLRYGPRTRVSMLGAIRTDQYEALRAQKGPFERAVEAQKKMRAATTPEELAAAVPTDSEVLDAMREFPFGNFENEIDRYCTYGGGEAAAKDPMLNALGTVPLSHLNPTWGEVSYEVAVRTLPYSEELLSFRRPLAEAWADHAIGAEPLSENSGAPLVGTGASEGLIAKRGRDSFHLVGGHVFLGDKQLMPPGNPLFDKVKVIAVDDFLVFALDDPGALPYRGLMNPQGIPPDVERRYRRGTYLYNVANRSWSRQDAFNVAGSSFDFVPETVNGHPAKLVISGYYREQVLLDSRY